MKRTNLMGSMVLFILICSCYQSSGQTNRFGLRLGISVPDLSNTEENIYSKDFSSRLVGEFALQYEAPFNNRLSFVTELAFTNRSGKRDAIQPIPSERLPSLLSQFLAPGTVLFGNFNNVTSQTFLELPLMLKYATGKAEANWRFYFQGGPHLAYMIYAEANTSGSSGLFLDESGSQQLQLPPPIPPLGDVSYAGNFDTSGSLNRFNYGFHAGFGISRELSNSSHLVFDVRASRSLRALQKDSTFGATKVGGLVFSLGYSSAI